MAPVRPYWKGHLKLSLVSCPIALYSGISSSERVQFRQINRKSGNRLRQQLIDEVTREPVEDAATSMRKMLTSRWTTMNSTLLRSSNHTIEIDSFVPRQQIDERHLDSTYYVTPDGHAGLDAFAVIREAMRGKAMA